MFPPDDPNKNKLADPEPKGPSPQEMATANALAWWNGLAGIPPGQIMQMLKMMGQQPQQPMMGMPRG